MNPPCSLSVSFLSAISLLLKEGFLGTLEMKLELDKELLALFIRLATNFWLEISNLFSG